MNTVDFLSGVLVGMVVTLCIIGVIMGTPDRNDIFSEHDDED